MQVYSASGAPAGQPLVRTLAPGEWTQWNGVLGLAGLPDGAFGYAKIRRTGGVGAFAAYGVVNDAKTSDGSYLPAWRPGGERLLRRRDDPSGLRRDDVKIPRRVEEGRNPAVPAGEGRLRAEGGAFSVHVRNSASVTPGRSEQREYRRNHVPRTGCVPERKVVPAQDWDTNRTAYEVARARLKAAEERYALVKEGPRVEEIEQGKADAKYGRFRDGHGGGDQGGGYECLHAEADALGEMVQVVPEADGGNQPGKAQDDPVLDGAITA